MNSKRSFLSLLIIVLFNFFDAMGWRPFQFEVENVTAYSLSDNVAINASIGDLGGINIFLDVKQVIKRPFSRFELYVDSGIGIFDLKWVNETVDLCLFFRDKKYLPVIQLIYGSVREQGNFPISCPIRKKLYAARDVKMDTEKLPSTMPKKRFFVGVRFLSKEGSKLKPLFQYKVISRIVDLK